MDLIRDVIHTKTSKKEGIEEMAQFRCLESETQCIWILDLF